MNNHTRIAILIVLLSIIILWAATLALCRWSAAIDCAEVSMLSPEDLVASSDVIGLARVVRANRVEGLSFSLDGISFELVIDQLVVVPVLAVRGHADSLSIWIPQSTDSHLTPNAADTIIVYGRLLNPDLKLFSDMLSTGSHSRFWDAATTAMDSSTRLQQALRASVTDMAVVYYSDRGSLAAAFSQGVDICYYDDRRKPHSVSTEEYWSEVVELIRSGE